VHSQLVRVARWGTGLVAFFSRFGDIWQTGKVEIIDDLFPSDVNYHLAPFPDMDRDGLKQFIAGFHQAFPDFALTIHEETTDGDTTTTRWSCTGTFTAASPLGPVAPTGRKTDASGGHFIHWRDGRPIEVWHHGDWLGWLQRCGVVPSLQVRAARERIVRSTSTRRTATIPTRPWPRSPAPKPATTSRHSVKPGGYPHHDAVRELFVGMFSVFPDFHIVSGPLRHGDDHVAVEVRLSGTQHADSAGIPSTGRSFDTRVAALYDFEGEELVRESVYLDFGEITRQVAGT
jgi:predicted ester cyclase